MTQILAVTSSADAVRDGCTMYTPATMSAP
jgi:hypothetical protein